MSGIYHMLAPFYDALNQEVDYASWLQSMEKQFAKYMETPPKRVLDLACGTGSMTIELLKAGYEVTGLDLSPEMLTVAQERIEKHGFSNVLLTMQDMTEFDVGGEYDAVVCTLDGINHLPQKVGVFSCFQCVRECLRPGGLFLFDVNSLFKFREIYGEEAYTMETENAFCVWQNDYRPKRGTCDFYINLFKKEKDGKYTRYEDVERETYYSIETLQTLAKKAGFEWLDAYGSQNATPITEEDDRWYITLRAI